MLTTDQVSKDPNHNLSKRKDMNNNGIPIHCACDKTVSTDTLIPNPRNPNKHSDRQISMLARIIKNTGWRNPITVSERSGFVIKGHARLSAAKLLREELVPVDMQPYENEAQEWQDMIADNQIAELAEMDKGELKLLIDDMPKLDVELIGFRPEELEKMFRTKETREGSPDELMDVSSELPGAQSLKPDMYFPSEAAYGIPAFRADMLAPIPEPIKIWAGKEASEPSEHYLYVLGNSSIRELDLTKCVLAFYTEDAKFDMAWINPVDFVSKLLNRKISIAVSPNFSLWGEMPEAVKIYNTYRSRWCGRYFQEAGIKLIPDVNFFDQRSFEYAFAGIPKNPPAISFQLQNATSNEDDKFRARQGVEEAIRRIEPESALFYVGDNGELLVSECQLNGVRPIIVNNWIMTRRATFEKIVGPKKRLKRSPPVHTY
jgi:hypothetical protein